MENEKKVVSVSMAAIDPYIETNMISPKETEIISKNRVEWGVRNLYPHYLFDLYQRSPTLATIVSGTTDYVAGDDATILPLGDAFQDGLMNAKGETIVEQVRDAAHDDLLYGGFAFQVIRSLSGDIVEIYHIDMRYLRCNKECNVFYYSERWDKPGNKKMLMYPAFVRIDNWAALDDAEKERNLASILYVKDTHFQTYPAPKYASAVVACEIEKNVGEYHLNAINNEFVSSIILNFCNGMPNDEQKKEIEKDVNEKFAGYKNAGRILTNYCADKAHSLVVDTPKVESFGDRYNALAKYARESIFTAFRAVPSLFGLMTESKGFSSEEFEQAFKLYNKTAVLPIQRRIADAYDKIYGQKGVLTIKPFDLNVVTSKVN